MIKQPPTYQINNQTILHESVDGNYQPTDEEIRQYALDIGFDVEQEPDLLWLAKEGLMKCLPPGWKACQNEKGDLYYFNFNSGQSSWDHPCDDVYRRRVNREREKRNSSDVQIPSSTFGNSTENVNNNTSKLEINSTELDFQSLFERDLSLDQRKKRVNSLSDGDFSSSETGTIDPANEEQRHNSAEIDRLSANVRSTSLERFRRRVEQSTDDEKLQILEEHRTEIDKFKEELQKKRREEEKRLEREVNREINLIKQNHDKRLERERRTLEQFSSQEENRQSKFETKLNMILLKNQLENEENLRQVERRHKSELDRVTRLYEEIRDEKTRLEQIVKQKSEVCSSLAREVDRLKSENDFLSLVESRPSSTVEKQDHSIEICPSTSTDSTVQQTGLVDSQRTLITREAVLKAVRDVFRVGVRHRIDSLDL